MLSTLGTMSETMEKKLGNVSKKPWKYNRWDATETDHYPPGLGLMRISLTALKDFGPVWRRWLSHLCVLQITDNIHIFFNLHVFIALVSGLLGSLDEASVDEDPLHQGGGREEDGEENYRNDWNITELSGQTWPGGRGPSSIIGMETVAIVRLLVTMVTALSIKLRSSSGSG